MMDRSQASTEPTAPSTGPPPALEEGLVAHASLRGRRGSRSPFTIGLAASAVVHGLAILLYSFLGVPSPQEFALQAPEEAGPDVAGTEIVRIVEVAAESEAASREPEEEEDPVEPEPVPEPEPDRGVVPGVRPEQPPGPRVITAGEVLRPDPADSVLLRAVDPELAAMTRQEELDARIRWAIEEFGDAEAAARRARAEALDWTYTDDDGQKWGVSPGTLHLGSVKLPLPSSLFGRTQGADAYADEMDARMGEIDAQAARGRVWETWERRGAAIRERKDRERAERAAAGDTTRSR